MTMLMTKKAMKVGDNPVYDVSLIHSRVLGLQKYRDINLNEVLQYELAPVPIAMLKDTEEMRIATAKMCILCLTCTMTIVSKV